MSSNDIHLAASKLMVKADKEYTSTQFNKVYARLLRYLAFLARKNGVK